MPDPAPHTASSPEGPAKPPLSPEDQARIARRTRILVGLGQVLGGVLILFAGLFVAACVAARAILVEDASKIFLGRVF
ncbi:MAG TPA: hypothetical protein VGO00_06540, partial [Kofleriaceae bacterium]|nr:hypothetical protein [Kofleriaceae bacterium]